MLNAWKVKVAQLCPILCNPMDCSLPGSSVCGILQARILEWVAFPFFPTQGLNPDLPHCRHILSIWATREAQEYWRWSPISSPGDLPGPGIELVSPAVQVDSLPPELPGKPPNAWKTGLYVILAWVCCRFSFNLDLVLCVSVYSAMSYSFNPIDLSLPGFSVHWILQERILEQVAISYSRGSSWPRDQASISWISCIGRQILYC